MSKLIGDSNTSQSAASFGQGYIQADEHLWDLELMRRQAHGTLAEIFGEDVLQHDKLVRTLGISNLAERALETL